jgi:hypothetical protein
MKASLLGFASFIAICAVPARAVAADWHLVAKAREGNIYVDAQGIVLKDKVRRAWDKWEYAEDQSGFPESGIKTFRASKHLGYYNCDDRSFGIAQVIYLDAKGKSVGQIALEVDPTSFSVVVPDSVSESQLNFVCGAQLAKKP